MKISEMSRKLMEFKPMKNEGYETYTFEFKSPNVDKTADNNDEDHIWLKSSQTGSGIKCVSAKAMNFLLLETSALSNLISFRIADKTSDADNVIHLSKKYKKPE